MLSTQCTETSRFGEDTPTEREERKKWTPTDDVVFISSWLNTSKDPVVGNEKKNRFFLERIAAYFATSPKVESGEKREAIQYEQRWQKIKDLFCKFVDPMKLQQDRKLVVRMRIMLNWHTKSSTTIIRRNSTFNMLGRSCAMTRNGVNLLLVRLMEALRREGMRIVHNQKAHKQLSI